MSSPIQVLLCFSSRISQTALCICDGLVPSLLPCFIDTTTHTIESESGSRGSMKKNRVHPSDGHTSSVIPLTKDSRQKDCFLVGREGRKKQAAGQSVRQDKKQRRKQKTASTWTPVLCLGVRCSVMARKHGISYHHHPLTLGVRCTVTARKHGIGYNRPLSKCIVHSTLHDLCLPRWSLNNDRYLILLS
jgi:hypothetical protein